MQGKQYTAIFIADNVSLDRLQEIRNTYEQIYTQISPFSNMQFNFTKSEGNSVSNGESEGKTENVSYGISEGTSQSNSKATTLIQGTSESTGSVDGTSISDSVSDGTNETTGYSKGTNDSIANSESESKSKSKGVSGGISIIVASGNINSSSSTSNSTSRTISHGTSHTDSVSNSITNTLTHGISENHSDSVTFGSNESTSKSESTSSGESHGKNYSMGSAFNLVNSKTLTDTFGSSQGITLNAQNMTLYSTLKKIEKHLNRIDECESLGMWNFAAYFLGEGAAETETAANTYQSVVSGVQSGIERAAVNTWVQEEDTRKISQYVKNFVHPYFLYQGFSYDGARNVLVNPSVLVSTNELAIHMGLPRHSVKGLPVIEHAIFAQEVLDRKKDESGKINLGNVYHLGKITDTKVRLDVDSLTMHAFIAGSTGAGKSNAVYHILNEVEKKKIPFLVVEPAKGEYRRVFRNIRCFGTNPNIGELIQINPFAFPSSIHVLEHIDRIVEIFNVCWPMYAAMPAVLKDSIERAYVAVGWDMDQSVNTKLENLFPTFEDVLEELNTTIKSSDYSVDTKGDYIGSLSTRLRSLTNGINGKIFVGNEMDLKQLFDESAIIDISRVGSMETKALIMGLVVLKLQEYRMANATEMNSNLKHLTILEEAHNLLKKTSTEQSQDSSNLQGKSVEMLTNTIAEIRTYGEGFVIVDQAPELLDTAAIRNTNTKIVLRLPEGNDRQLTGTSMALNEKQIKELSKLQTGVAAVYQNDWQEAVLCKLPKYAVEGEIEEKSNNYTLAVSTSNLKDKILHTLLKDSFEETEVVTLKDQILKSNVSAKIRKDLICNIEKKNLVYEWAVADFINKNYHFSDVFKGTEDGQWESLDELSQIMQDNISDQFDQFDEKEMKKILYYICRVEHEKFPENHIIEQLRVEYLKKEMVR